MKSLTLCCLTLVLVAGPLAGRPAETRSPLDDDPQVAIRQVEALVPVGTPQTEAVWTLGRMGFALFVMHGYFGAENFSKFIFCDYRRFGNQNYHRWQVALILKNSRVADYRIAMVPKGQ